MPKITQLLADANGGSPDALAEVMSLLQAELRSMAAAQLRGERKSHTLQPTALVNEAYLKLVAPEGEGDAPGFSSRSAFLGYAAVAMRRILLEHARARLAEKRGGGALRVTFFEAPSATEEEPESTVLLDDALEDFAKIDPRGAKVVELRWFGGLTNAEVATALDTSERTIERDWRAARAWLRARLDAGSE